MMKNNYIFDFDSTIVSVETLDVLAEVALQNNARRKEVVSAVEEITKLGMEGRLSFTESLEKRLQLFQPTKGHIAELVHRLQKSISESFLSNKDFFRENQNNIYVVSGGFEECIVPVVEILGILPMNVYGNSFRFDERGNVIGWSNNSPLSRSGGKADVVKRLELEGNVWVIGDGITDYQIYEKGYADGFIAYTEHVTRTKVVENAPYAANSLDEILTLITKGTQ
jgi:D-3-phosphoglycerate dehydrogenase